MRLITISLYVLLLSIMIFGCQTNLNITSELVIENAIKAYGGEKNLNHIESKREEGSTIIYMSDTIYRSSQYINFQKSGGKSYYASPIKAQKHKKRLVFASNGKYSWTQNDGALAPYMQPKEEHKDLEGEDYPYFFTLKERNIKVTYQGKKELNGISVYHLDYSNAQGDVEKVFFDANKWYIVEIQTTIKTSQGLAENIRKYYDFRNVNGVVTPFRTESYYPPNEKDVYLIDELNINETLSDSIFNFPEPYAFSIKELQNLNGKYKSQEGNQLIEILVQNENFQVLFNNNEVTPLVVDQELIMFRNGEGYGSWIFNIKIPYVSKKVDFLDLYMKNEVIHLIRE